MKLAIAMLLLCLTGCVVLYGDGNSYNQYETVNGTNRVFNLKVPHL
jgi:hypothetical protein